MDVRGGSVSKRADASAEKQARPQPSCIRGKPEEPEAGGPDAPSVVAQFGTSQQVHSAGLEPATYGFEVRRSIQLSYECLTNAPYNTGREETRVGEGDRTLDLRYHKPAL